MTSRSETPTGDLARKLMSRAYGEFFVFPANEETIDRIWAEVANRPTLEALVADPTAPIEARFLASEVLFAQSRSPFADTVHLRAVRHGHVPPSPGAAPSPEPDCP